MHFRRIDSFALILELFVKGLIFMPSERKKELEATRETLINDKLYYNALSCIAIDIANIANECRDNPRDLNLPERKKTLSDAIKRFDDTKGISATIRDVYNPGKHANSYKGGYKKKIDGKYPEMKKLLKNWWKDPKDDIIDEMNFEKMYDEAHELNACAIQMREHIGELLSRNTAELLQN